MAKRLRVLVVGPKYTSANTDAPKLGAATGAYVADRSGVYYRTFAGGRVVVNPTDTARLFQGTTYLPTTGTVTLTG